jgi:SAM-dependent methyltransferase
MVDNNYLFHREAYACLRKIVTREPARPIRFLDIACGDASATVDALVGTCLTQYCGIDLSGEALALAAQNLAALGCPVTLERGDFQDVLVRWQEPVDVAWVGLSLHHLDPSGKLAVMREIRRIVGAGGLFLAYENASPNGEDRAGWLRRWDSQEAHWIAYSGHEWQTITTHVHTCDFPETCAGWHSLGRDAGFQEVREIFVAPTNLFRMYLFQP